MWSHDTAIGVKPWSQIPLYIVPDTAATEHNDVTMMSVNMFLFSQHRNWAVAGAAGQSWAAGLNKSISDGLVAGGGGGGGGGGGDAGTRHTGSGAVDWAGDLS